jgi:hypothetical protein
LPPTRTKKKKSHLNSLAACALSPLLLICGVWESAMIAETKAQANIQHDENWEGGNCVE